MLGILGDREDGQGNRCIGNGFIKAKINFLFYSHATKLEGGGQVG